MNAPPPVFCALVSGTVYGLSTRSDALASALASVVQNDEATALTPAPFVSYPQFFAPSLSHTSAVSPCSVTSSTIAPCSTLPHTPYLKKIASPPPSLPVNSSITLLQPNHRIAFFPTPVPCWILASLCHPSCGRFYPGFAVFDNLRSIRLCASCAAFGRAKRAHLACAAGPTACPKWESGYPWRAASVSSVHSLLSCRCFQGQRVFLAVTS